MGKSWAVILAVLLALCIPSGAFANNHPCMMNDDMMGGMGHGMGMGQGMMGCGMGMMGMGQGMMGCGMGMMGMGQGMMGGMDGMGPYGMIDVTPDQRTKINKITDDLRKQHFGVMGKMLDEQAKLRDLFSEEKPDPKKIGAVYDAVSALRRKLVESRIEAMNSIHDILTKEQRDQMKQFMRGTSCGMGRGGGSGMGPGTGSGPMRHEMMEKMMGQ